MTYRRIVLALVASAAMGCGLANSAASAAGDPDAGADVALRWCTSCHLIRPSATAPVLQGPPTFAAMARERTPDALRSFLTHPHAPMPPIELSRADIENLVAYIQTLR